MIYRDEVILPILKNNPHDTASDLKRKIQGADRKSVNQTLYALAKKGLVTRHQNGQDAPTWTVDENPVVDGAPISA